MPDFKTMMKHCKHQGMIKEGKYWCSFRNGVPAKFWSDWQECTADNCPLINRRKKDPAEIKFEQISLIDYMGKEK